MTNEENAEKKIVYVEDHPFRVLLKHFLIVAVTSVVIIFVIGFITGLLGQRVPYIDSGAIGNQWSTLTGGHPGPAHWNELEKNK